MVTVTSATPTLLVRLVTLAGVGAVALNTGVAGCDDAATFEVAGVVDGDTIDVRRDGEERREAARRAEAESPAQEEAPRAGQQRPSGTRSSPGSGSGSGSGGYDGYTGCRPYGGDYAPNAADEQGRPYTKIDCSSRAPIG